MCLEFLNEENNSYPGKEVSSESAKHQRAVYCNSVVTAWNAVTTEPSQSAQSHMQSSTLDPAGKA